MIQKYRGYQRRGYPADMLNGILLQATTRKRKEWKRERKVAFTSIKKNKQKVIALKLPYTNRSIQVSHEISVTKLQKQIENSCPALNRANMGRLVVANLSTPNMLDRTRPKGLMAGCKKSER